MLTRAFEDTLYREYMDFFATAERKRRWSVFDDIPWDRLSESVNDRDRALCAETFCGVEMYLPDYVAEGLNMARESFGHAWFHANWAYEESKHGLALREYLVRSGQRSADQMYDYERAILSRRWTMPFKTPRQMVCYGAIQEAATFVIYRKQLKSAESAGDHVLASIYRLIARDEAAHAGFYVTVLNSFLAEDREAATRDLSHVLRNFTMPAFDLVPEYDTRVALMRQVGIDRGVFFEEIVFPLLKRTGVRRRDLVMATSSHNEIRSNA